MKKFKVGKMYQVVGYKKFVDEKVKVRLLEFGFTRGERFVISHKSFFGENVIVEIRGFLLSLRSKFLNFLEVE